MTTLGRHPGNGIVPSHVYDVPPNPETFLLPSVILWDPLMTLSHLLTTKIIICPHSQYEKHLTSAKYWNDGKTSHQQPRLIHVIRDIVFLVSAVYASQKFGT